MEFDTGVPANATIAVSSTGGGTVSVVSASGTAAQIKYTAPTTASDVISFTLAGATLSLAVPSIYAFPTVLSFTPPSVAVTVGTALPATSIVTWPACIMAIFSSST